MLKAVILITILLKRMNLPKSMVKGHYYIELSASGGQIYAETRLPKPGMSIPELRGSTLLGEATNKTGIAKRIAELLTDAGQVSAVRICTKGEYIRFVGNLSWLREPIREGDMERILALVAEKKPGLQILRSNP